MPAGSDHFPSGNKGITIRADEAAPGSDPAAVQIVAADADRGEAEDEEDRRRRRKEEKRRRKRRKREEEMR